MLIVRRSATGWMVAMAAALVASTGYAQESWTLRRVVKAGEVQAYRVVMDASGEIIPQGATTGMNFDMQMTMGYQEKVTAVDENGTFNTNMQFTSMKVTVMGNEMPMPDDLKKAVILLKTDPRGRVLEAKGLDQVASQMQSPVAAGMPGASTAVFPEEPLKVGDTWTTEVPMPQDKSIILKSVHRLKSVTEGKGVLIGTIQTDIEFPTEALTKSMPAGMPVSTTDGSMKMTMLSRYDMNTGVMLGGSGDMIMNMKMKMAMPTGPDQSAPPTEMAMNMTYRINITKVAPVEINTKPAVKPAAKPAAKPAPKKSTGKR